MIESQGGQIQARNGPAGGAVLELTIPIAGATSQTGSGTQAPPVKVALRVIFVDDEPDIRNFAEKLFAMVGYQVSVAASVSDALTQLEQEEFDVLVADYNMPDGTGLDLFKAAKAAGRDLTGRAVFISGTADGAELRQAVSVSHGQFLAKPFNASQIIAMVSNAIRHAE